MIFSGKVEINWICFIRNITWIKRRLHELNLTVRTGMPLYVQLYRDRTPRESMTLYPQEDTSKCDILQVLTQARWLQLKLDSDRIYGYLAFAEDAKLFQGIRPDHSLPALAVYADCARRYVRKKRGLSILHYVQHTNVTIAETNIPSWIPRWNLSVFPDIRFGLNKSTSLSWIPWPNFPLLTGNGDILKVWGIVFDYVRFTSNILSQTTHMDEIGRLWRSISGSGAVTVYPQRYRETIFLQNLSMGPVVGDHSRWISGFLAYRRFLNLDATLSEQEK